MMTKTKRLIVSIQWTFQLEKSEQITRERSTVFFNYLILPKLLTLLRAKIDDVYHKMKKLYDRIINQCIQTLFEESSNSEQIRILTIAPASWGRNKIVDFFNCTEHQARASIELRQTNGILAFPTFLRGNEPTDLVTIDKILSYYRRDGISRPSPNRKDVVLINGTYVGKRFIENPSIDIGKSKFFSLRPKDVKPESPHEVCLCIYHENMALLLKSTVQLNDLICSCVCSTEDEAC
ncbi:unnamed protein product [Adineta ricciae]|uniref:Uncharacterized protein n=1 Tax=Adineta ricciae TaxID=249248 RepID=A0A815U4P8_ADIRI|nr:unnamed protein product [Adineta ricciae]